MSDLVDRIGRCVPALRRYAWALLRDDQEADDLVHDCLVRALGRPPTRHLEADVRPWLFTILHNLWVDRRRRARARGEPVPLEEADAAGAAAVAPAQGWGPELRDLVRGLDRLPEEQRVVLLLVGVEGLPYAEAARVLDVPMGTVMSRLSRGRERLRRYMEGEGGRDRQPAAARPLLRRVK